jgi:deazaflavin-dependent oxidoreductase (nitroreductase family)
MGVKHFPMILLTVRGRKSGQPRTTPIVMTEQDGQRYLIGSFGDVNWVRNLRAAGEATVTRGRRAEQVAIAELTPAEAAPVLKQVLAIAPGMIRDYFDVTAASSLEEIEREAPRHPVFLMRPAAEATQNAGRDLQKSGSR